MTNGFTTDIGEQWEKFQELTSQEMTKAIKKALNGAAAALQTLTKSNLGTSISHDTGGEGRYNDKMTDAVRRTSAKGYYDEELYAVVHIMGTQASGSGTFRARFLEKGTKDRYAKTYKGQPLRKPRYLGAVGPRWFFKSANQAIEPQLERIYLEQIDNTIQKLNAAK